MYKIRVWGFRERIALNTNTVMSQDPEQGFSAARGMLEVGLEPAIFSSLGGDLSIRPHALLITCNQRSIERP